MIDRAQTLSCLRSRVLRRRAESGAAVVEFAIVAGVFMMILYLFIAFGMALSLKQRVTNAAAAGARAAVGASDPVATATARAQEAMGGCTGPDCTITATVVPAGSCPGTSGACIDVTVSAKPVIQDGFGVAVPDTVESTANVQI